MAEVLLGRLSTAAYLPMDENSFIGERLGYFLVQKAKEAKTVGILVGTLGAGMICALIAYAYCTCICMYLSMTVSSDQIHPANYLAISERLKQILKDAGKKVHLLGYMYIIYMYMYLLQFHSYCHAGDIHACTINFSTTQWLWGS